MKGCIKSQAAAEAIVCMAADFPRSHAEINTEEAPYEKVKSAHD